MSRTRRVLKQILLIPVALVLLFEEWGWDRLASLFGVLARLPLWARIERWIESLPPWSAVALFFVPALALLPIKLLALFFIGRGHALLGLLVLLTAKVVGTALLAWLFALTQPALMRLAWFARWYPRWKAWKDRVMGIVWQSATWRTASAFRRKVRMRWAAVKQALRI